MVLRSDICSGTNSKLVYEKQELEQPWKQITKPWYDKVGLGPYTAYTAITEYFKGRIWVESSEDAGTTYFVEIPLESMYKV